MSFTEMMQQAIQIRTCTDAKLRVDFDSRPKFQQSSMFATQEVRDARGLPLGDRLAVCTAMKLRGNAQMRVGNYGEACQTYEQALAMFWYLENHNSGWKTSGIKDEDIAEVNFCPAFGVQAFEDETRDMKVALLLNIARAYSAQGDYATSVKACGAALATNPSCAKALYLRGKALVTPASAGAFETEEAIRDVARAADLAPGDNLIKAFLTKLRAERARQKEADRATFAGMFDRGEVCTPKAESEPSLHAPTHGDGEAERGVLCSAEAGGGGDASTAGSLPGDDDHDNNDDRDDNDDHDDGTGGKKSRSASARRMLEMRRDVEDRVAFFKGMVRECTEEGREEEADQYRERIEAIEEILSEHDRQEQERVAGLRKSRAGVDWRNPTEAMLKKAVEEEYDLDNPAVISFLVNMQEGHQAKLEAPRREGRPHGGGSSECEEHNGDNGSTEGDRSLPDEDADQDNWTEEVWEGAILCMTRPEVTSLLKEELGLDLRPDTSLQDLRNLAVSKRADWKISAAISLLLFVFKAYQMGLFKLLLTGENPTTGSVDTPGVAYPMMNSGDRLVEQEKETARGRGRTRRGWERRSHSSSVHTNDASSGRSIVGGAEVGGHSLAARALASAAQAENSVLSEESEDWCDSSVVDGACIAGAERGRQAASPMAEDE